MLLSVDLVCQGGSTSIAGHNNKCAAHRARRKKRDRPLHCWSVACVLQLFHSLGCGMVSALLGGVMGFVRISLT